MGKLLITGTQIRSARAVLRWTSAQLADRCELGIQTIKRLEQFDGLPPARAVTLDLIQRTLEAAGIEFIGTPDDGPGVRYRPPKA